MCGFQDRGLVENWKMIATRLKEMEGQKEIKPSHLHSNPAWEMLFSWEFIPCYGLALGYLMSLEGGWIIRAL